MYSKVFDGNYAGELVGDMVSLKAAFAFASMIFNSDSQGIVTGWFRAMGPLKCSYEEWELLVTELCEAGFVERYNSLEPIAGLMNGRMIVDRIIQYRILDFSPPDRIERLSPETWSRLREATFERDNYLCQYCFTDGEALECDHIVPLAKGGTNEPSNLITACYKCNRSKRDKQITEWRGRKGDHAPA